MRWKSFPKYVYSIALVWLYAIQKKKKKKFKDTKSSLYNMLKQSCNAKKVNSSFLSGDFVTS